MDNQFTQEQVESLGVYNDATERMEKNISIVGWCIIPASVMSRNDISASDKLIYGRIMGLSDKDGYCWASNEWLGKQVGLTADRVSRIISKLVNLGLVKRQISYKASKEIDTRMLFPQIPIGESTDTPRCKHQHSNRDELKNKEIISKDITKKSKLEEINTLGNFADIAEKYDVPVQFVASKYEDLVNYCAATGKVYKDYLAALRNWTKRDAEKLRKEDYYATRRNKIAVYPGS